MKVILKNARLAFPQLFTAKAVDDKGDPRFSASFIIEKTHPQVAELVAAMQKVANDKWGAKGADTYKQLKAGDKLALHNGDTKSNYAGFEGNLFVSAANKVRPAVRAADGRTTLTAADGKPYGGCYVNAVIEVWAQDNGFGKRINASLMGVQFVRDGEPFSGGGVASDDDFEAVEGAEDVFGDGGEAPNPLDDDIPY